MKSFLVASLALMALEVACSTVPPSTTCEGTCDDRDGAASDAGSTDSTPTLSDASGDVQAKDGGKGGDAKGPTPGVPVGPYGHVLYLNFSGAVLDYGLTAAPKNTSSLSMQGITTTIPPFREVPAIKFGGATSRADAIARIRAKVSALFAPFDVQVVTERPPIDAYTMIMIGGNGKDADYTDGAAGGVSTKLVCGASDLTDVEIGYVFAESCSRDVVCSNGLSGIIDALAKIATHEAGHLYGLSHHAAGSIMSGFSDHTLAWGSGAVVNDVSSCNRTSQDDVQMLTSFLGAQKTRPAVPAPPDTTPPSLVVSAPADGNTVGPGFTPCVTASDGSALRYLMAEIYAKPSPAFQDEILIARQVVTKAPFVLGPMTGLAGLADGPITVRIASADQWDNLSIETKSVKLSSAAAASTCP